MRPLRPEFNWFPAETLGANPGSLVIDAVLPDCGGLLSAEPVAGVGDGVPIARAPPLPQATMGTTTTMAEATMIKRR